MSAQGHVLKRMSLCGHQVPNKDVAVEDVFGGDIPIENMSVEDNPVEDLMSTQGHTVLVRMSLWGHHVLAEDVWISCPRQRRPRGDVLSTQGRLRADVPVKDIYVCFYFCPFVHDR